MNIQFPEFNSWRVIFKNKNPFSVFGNQTQKRIKKAQALLEKYGYTFQIEEVDENYLETFIPLYEANIRSKKNGVIYPIRQMINFGKAKGKEYKSVSFYTRDKKKLGGLIFSLNSKNKFIGTAYKVFPHSIPEKLPISISFVAEVCFYTYALNLGFLHISHGSDLNIYGYHSNIGLAEYKLQVGCRPFFNKIRVSNNELNRIITRLPKSTEDMLIFLGGNPDEFITQALLVSEKSMEDLIKKHPILFSSPHFKTTVVSHNQVPSES